MIVCTVRAGVIGSIGYAHAPIAVAHAPVAVAAPVALAAPAVAVAHGASSYQNSNLLALNPTAVVTKFAAPVVAAPVITKYAAPVVAAPVALGLGLCLFNSLCNLSYSTLTVLLQVMDMELTTELEIVSTLSRIVLIY